MARSSARPPCCSRSGAADVRAADAGAAVDVALETGALRYCPVCDGYEVAGLDVGVLCDSAAGLHEAWYLRHFTPRLRVFCARAGIEVGADDQHRLAALGIAFDPAPATDIRLVDGRVAVVHGGRTSLCDSLYSALGMRVHSGLAAALGAALDADGYVVTDRHQQTSVDGLYGAGDMAKGLNQISVAIGGAALAASAMHLRLLDRAR